MAHVTIPTVNEPTRRCILNASFALAASVVGGGQAVQAGEGQDHFPFGALARPRAIPSWPVLSHEGKSTTLPTVLRGRFTALQLMFTSCNAICPLQAAIFAKTQTLAADIPQVQFASLSIDPATDVPAAMAAWLKKFKAGESWVALTPRSGDLQAIFKLLGDGGLAQPKGVDPHSGQIYLISRKGELVYRTPALPSAQQLAEAMHGVARQAG